MGFGIQVVKHCLCQYKLLHRVYNCLIRLHVWSRPSLSTKLFLVEQVRIVLDMVLQQGYFIEPFNNAPIHPSIKSYFVLDLALQHGYLTEPFVNLYIYTTMDSYLVFNWELQNGYLFEPFDNLYIYTCTTMDQYLVFNWALQHGYFIEPFNNLPIYSFNWVILRFRLGITTRLLYWTIQWYTSLSILLSHTS